MRTGCFSFTVGASSMLRMVHCSFFRNRWLSEKGLLLLFASELELVTLLLVLALLTNTLFLSVVSPWHQLYLLLWPFSPTTAFSPLFSSILGGLTCMWPHLDTFSNQIGQEHERRRLGPNTEERRETLAEHVP